LQVRSGAAHWLLSLTMRASCARVNRLRRSEHCWITSPRGRLPRASFEKTSPSSAAARRALFSSSVTPGGGGGGGVSKRDFAQLEDALHRAAGSVVDPVVGRSLSSLQWLDKRLALSEDGRALRMLLRMPSLLHPRLAELKDRVREAAEAAMRASPIPVGAESATVEAIAGRPVPFAARLLHAQDEEDGGRDEVLAGLGPGLAGVAHVVAVYSCKVRVSRCSHDRERSSRKLLDPRVPLIFQRVCSQLFDSKMKSRAGWESRRWRSTWRTSSRGWAGGWGCSTWTCTARPYPCWSGRATRPSGGRRWGRGWSSR
jgi:hypothetical protein